eukprot:1725784-Alexandrium_andersonii.AAC.1
MSWRAGGRSLTSRRAARHLLGAVPALCEVPSKVSPGTVTRTASLWKQSGAGATEAWSLATPRASRPRRRIQRLRARIHP